MLVRNVVGKLQPKRTLAASRGSLRQHGFLVVWYTRVTDGRTEGLSSKLSASLGRLHTNKCHVIRVLHHVIEIHSWYPVWILIFTSPLFLISHLLLLLIIGHIGPVQYDASLIASGACEIHVTPHSVKVYNERGSYSVYDYNRIAHV